MLDRYGLVCEYLYEDFEESGVSTKIFQLRPNKLDLADVNERKCDTQKAYKPLQLHSPHISHAMAPHRHHRGDRANRVRRVPTGSDVSHE